MQTPSKEFALTKRDITTISMPWYLQNYSEAVEKPLKHDLEAYFYVISICFYYVPFFQKCGNWAFSTTSADICNVNDQESDRRKGVRASSFCLLLNYFTTKFIWPKSIILPFSCNAMLQEPPKYTSAVEALKNVTSLPNITFRHDFSCPYALNLTTHPLAPSIFLFAIIESELRWEIPLQFGPPFKRMRSFTLPTEQMSCQEKGWHILRFFFMEFSLCQTIWVTLPIWKLPIIGPLILFDLKMYLLQEYVRLDWTMWMFNQCER